MLSHRNIVAHTRNAVPVAPMGPGDRNLVAMPLFYALPRNPSGKVLKRKLRAPFWEGRDRQI